MIVPMIVIGVFILFGFIFINGKGDFLIAGYNTMSREEREKHDMVAVCKFMGKMMFALAFSMVFWVVSEVYGIEWLFHIGLILFIAIVIFMLIYTNTGNRFKKQDRHE